MEQTLPEQALIERLTPRAPRARVFRDLLRIRDRQSAVGPIDDLLERMTPLTMPLRQLLLESGIKINVSLFILTSLCAGLLAQIAVARLIGMMWASLVVGAIATALPWMLVSTIRTRRLAKLEEALPDAIDLIARSLRAGHALLTGIGMAADEVPQPLGAEFRILYDEQNFGLSMPDALRNFARRVPVLDARFFVTAVLTQRETGGNLAEVLNGLASVIRERFRVRRQVRVISAHGRITGLVLALMPPVLAAVIFVQNPSYLMEFARDPLGLRMIIIALCLQVIGVLAIRRIVRIEV